jgi:6-phosphogluconolactonase
MSFLRAARAALAGQSVSPRNRRDFFVIVVVALGGLSFSCGTNSHLPGPPNHDAYVTLPATGSVLQLHINGSNGTMTIGSKTPATQNTTPTGLALLPSKKFLYAINSDANSISIFSVASDGSLNLAAQPTPTHPGPNAALIDPTGAYLLVTNNIEGDISVYSIDSSSGALSEVAGSPFPANNDPTQMVFKRDGQFLYVTNPNIGMVTAFKFDPTALNILTQVVGSPVFSGAGAISATVDTSDRFLYVMNPSANNVPPYSSTIGNVSGFNIDQTTGALTPMLGSPFAPLDGTVGPTTVLADPSGKFVYAIAPGSSFSIWCFTINADDGQLVSATGSPFSLAAGGLFALFDQVGHYLYIGSQNGNGVEGYTYNPSTGVPAVIAGSPFVTGTAPGAMVLSE